MKAYMKEVANEALHCSEQGSSVVLLLACVIFVSISNNCHSNPRTKSLRHAFISEATAAVASVSVYSPSLNGLRCITTDGITR
eukprot:m.232476 g.232476  ORF g.232476 m.232476 type:complete len:83 (-) comp17076_c3_seq2:265-513(-)